MTLQFPTGEGNLINYNWSDLATGTGYKTFYCTANIVGSSVGYILEPETLPSHLTNTNAVNTSQEVNFDLLFNVSTKLKGNAIINIPVAAWNASGDSRGLSVTSTIKLYKVAVGGTETQLGSTISHDLVYSVYKTADPQAAFGYEMFAGKVTIPNTTFKPGESLRVEVVIGASGYTNIYMIICHDPKNYGLNFGGYDVPKVLTTTSSINLPFKINL